MRESVDGSAQVSPRIAYIICSNPRTGSRMLCRGLRETGVCGSPDEHFHNDYYIPEAMKKYGIKNFPDYLRLILREKTGPNGVFGTKVHWTQFGFLMKELNKIECYRDSSAAETLRRTFGDVRYIFITRRNKVKQAVSWLIAQQTNIWEDPGSRSAPFQGAYHRRRPKFDYQLICHFLREIEKDELSWRRFFSENSISPLEIVYEDMVGFFPDTLDRTLKYLGLEHEGARQVFTSSSKRQSGWINEIWVKWYLCMHGWLKNKKRPQ